MKKYIYKSATELAELIRKGNATSTQIIKEHFEQIKLHNNDLNAIVINFEKEALLEAECCDKETLEGKYRGPLHGVPITVKEQFWIKGVKSTLNFKMLKNWRATTDAVIIERLKNAGAIIIGKTNVPKNLTDSQVNGDIYKEGKNPYDLNLTPGGSSGGSATAIASGMTPIGLGSDLGGSIRNPANFCGLYGLKPTESTIPLQGAMPNFSNTKGFVFHMAQAGPLARNIEDIELLWSVIKGEHNSDRTVSPIKWKDCDDLTCNDFKISWIDSWSGYMPSSETKNVISSFIKKIEDSGFKITNTKPPELLHQKTLSLSMRLFSQLISQSIPWYIKPLVKIQLKKGLLKGVKLYNKEINNGFKDSFKYYSETMGIRAEIISEWETYFEKNDILICPTGFGPAFKRSKIGEPIIYNGKKIKYFDYVWPYLGCFNGSGHPCLTIPLGLNKEGLPIGIQIVGAYWSEPKLIQFTKLISKFNTNFIQPPNYKSR